MPVFLLFERHSPENCPMFNEKTRKIWIECNEKIEGLAKKYGVKLLGSWVVGNEHLGVDVCEAPSLDALTKLFIEPAMLALGSFNTVEIKFAFTSEEVAKMMQKAK
jgi:uncharacterized protein with GYD domain